MLTDVLQSAHQMMNGIGVACGAAEALICRQETGLAAIICTMQVEDVDLEGNHIVVA